MMTDFAPVHRQASVWPGAVAVVGLGQMGLPIALRLLAAAFRVTGCRRREPPAPFLAAGGRCDELSAEIDPLRTQLINFARHQPGCQARV
jgi:hypothetical protein